ncbi:hypothetical protein FE257_001207 [Aspergillus nanangensis]|uniref:Xylanolytic transcriptional activator regulatory domain-containing protein n=1 Tax=Aspergillus nanangensis TaxID=2582783 RepID=A0AAD4GP55_ASPNN|nr:hypothetical protein FE257_001207 [Aspergillus nanangensis]
MTRRDTHSLRSAGSILNNVTYFNGIYLLSTEGRTWIESRTGEKVNFEKLCALELPWENTHHSQIESSLDSLPSIEIPNRYILDTYVTMYASSLQSLVFPVISKSLFKHTLDLAYDPQRPIGSTSAKSCVYSFLAIVSLFGFDADIQGVMDCGSYAVAARGFTDQIIQEMTLDGLQSFTMLVQFQYFLGDLQAAAVSLSIATCLLYSLGAHTLPSDDPLGTSQPYDKSNPECHLRDLFWLCYSFDKDISLRTGQPPCINDTHCDLTLPTDYAQLQERNIQRDEILSADNTLPLFPFDLHLSLIKSEAYQTLYSFSAQQKTNSEILSRIMNLDEALEKWRMSLHPDFRPTLSFFQEMQVCANVNTQAVILRLAYYHCVTIIHQASTRCKLSPGDNESQLDGISSSISLSINASRSTLSYLRTVLPVVKGECFWVVLFYAITAILTIFSNILRSPLDPETYVHLDILCDVPDLIRKIPIRKLTLGEPDLGNAQFVRRSEKWINQQTHGDAWLRVPVIAGGLTCGILTGPQQLLSVCYKLHSFAAPCGPILAWEQFSKIISLLFVSGALVAAAPGSADPRDIFQLEKRCQHKGDYCDGAAIRCCAGQCCTERHGGIRYCQDC